MASDHLLLTSSESDGDFTFAFNDVNFSDHLLRIEILRGGEVTCSSIVDWVRDRKRKREEDHGMKDSNETYETGTNVTNSNDNNNKKHAEAMVMTEQESQPGGELNNNSIMRFKELHINSAILAAKSPFFYKLFSINGKIESDQQHLTIKIDAYEESAVMELLKFMYSNSLPSTLTIPALLDILMAADKFQVDSCMKYVSCLLLKIPMTLDSALLLLDLPSSLLMADSAKLLANAARQFIATRYKEIYKFPIGEVMALPLAAFEAILASDELQIASEDIIYKLVLKWVKLHYSTLEERQEILGSHLARYIRFPHMTCQRLKNILTSDDFTTSIASKLVLEALFFKAESLHNPIQPLNQRFVERAYKKKPIKTVEFEVPRQRCIVYLDLKRKECEGLYPSNRITSQAFCLGGHGFFLSAHCTVDQKDLLRCFGLFLAMQDKGSSSSQNPNITSENLEPALMVEYLFSARSKPTEDFVERYKGNFTFIGGRAIGQTNFFGIPWDNFLDKDCPYFINDVLHLRAELSIRV